MAGVMNTMRSFGGMGQGHRNPDVKRRFQCHYCEEWGRVKMCRGCQRVSYCGRECQRRVWKVHKEVCGPLHEPVD